MSQDDQVRLENEEDEVEAHKQSTKANTVRGEDTTETDGEDDFEAHRNTKARPSTR